MMLPFPRTTRVHHSPYRLAITLGANADSSRRGLSHRAPPTVGHNARVKRALVVLSLVACTKPAPPPPADAAPELTSRRASWAAFEKDVPTTCIDLRLDASTPGDWERAKARYGIDQRFTEVPKPCEQQFPRAAPSACHIAKTSDAGPNEDVFESYYDVPQIDPGNAHLRNCLARGGAWIELHD